MARTLAEYFASVTASDIHPYGFGDVSDFTHGQCPAGSFDWVITNPPFRLTEAFLLNAFRVARVGVAMMSRTVLIA
jgi:hypothetical protein